MFEDRLTVVIPTHNRSALLAQAIESVLRSDLRLSPDAVIVVDDASNDGSDKVAASFGVRYRRVSAGRPSATRNRGLELVETEFVTFLDDDDVWLRNHMQQHLLLMSSDPSLGYVYGQVQGTDIDLSPVGGPFPAMPPRGISAVDQALFHTPQIGAVLFRTNVLVAAGGFDEDVYWQEDRDALVRVALTHDAAGVDDTGLLFRMRPWTTAALEGPRAAWRDYRLMRTKWIALGVPRRALWRFELIVRSTHAYHACRSARHAAALGDGRAALRLAISGLMLSPVHTLANRRLFWPTLVELARQRIPGQRLHPAPPTGFW